MLNGKDVMGSRGKGHQVSCDAYGIQFVTKCVSQGIMLYKESYQFINIHIESLEVKI